MSLTFDMSAHRTNSATTLSLRLPRRLHHLQNTHNDHYSPSVFRSSNLAFPEFKGFQKPPVNETLFFILLSLMSFLHVGGSTEFKLVTIMFIGICYSLYHWRTFLFDLFIEYILLNESDTTVEKMGMGVLVLVWFGILYKGTICENL